MTALFTVDDGLICNPVQLDRATPAFVGMMAMPRLIRAFEDQQGPGDRLDLDRIVFEIRAVPKEA